MIFQGKNLSSRTSLQLWWNTFSIILGTGQHSYTSGFKAWCYAPIIWLSQVYKDNNAHALKNKRVKISCSCSANTIRMLESYSLCYPIDSATAFEKYFEKKGGIIQCLYRQCHTETVIFVKICVAQCKPRLQYNGLMEQLHNCRYHWAYCLFCWYVKTSKSILAGGHYGVRSIGQINIKQKSLWSSFVALLNAHFSKEKS